MKYPGSRGRGCMERCWTPSARAWRWSGTLEVRRTDGSTFPGLLSIAPIRDDEGVIQGTVAVCRDVTEHRRHDEQQRFLVEAGTVLASSLDYTTTLEGVARLVVPGLADWCFVDIVEREGSIRRVASVHADPQKEEVFRVAVPMVARRRRIGVIRVATTDPARPRLGADDVAVFEALARVAAFAIDNARSYQDAKNAIAVRDSVLSTVGRADHGWRGHLRDGGADPGFRYGAGHFRG